MVAKGVKDPLHRKGMVQRVSWRGRYIRELPKKQIGRGPDQSRAGLIEDQVGIVAQVGRCGLGGAF